jgi:hypothetical protein
MIALNFCDWRRGRSALVVPKLGFGVLSTSGIIAGLDFGCSLIGGILAVG